MILDKYIAFLPWVYSPVYYQLVACMRIKWDSMQKLLAPSLL